MNIFTTLSFIRKEQEHDDVYTFYFARPKNLKFKAGQHGVFIPFGVYRPHPFSISSSPVEENWIAFSTHIASNSRYKRKLMSLSIGDTVLFLGPLLNFTYRTNARKYVFLAQGIGVTPFRSMLVSAHAAALPLHTTLVHVDSTTHSFRKTTQLYASKSYYPTTADAFRKIVKQQDTNQLFYISGSPSFIRSTRKLLKDQGVTAGNIVTDSFLGY